MFDLIFGGCVEIMVGCGLFVELFLFFGFDFENYDELFVIKLEWFFEVCLCDDFGVYLWLV